MAASPDYVSVTVTSNLNVFQSERRFPSTISLSSLKGKLELLTGASMGTMKIELRDHDQELIKPLKDDSMTLSELGVENGMFVHVIDTATKEDDESPEVGFELSAEDYASREETARNFLMKNKLGKYDENKIQQKKEEDAKEAVLADNIPVGVRCEVSTVGAAKRRGEIKYVGTVNFNSGVWVGVQYDEPLGKNDGSVNGKQYWEGKPKYGGFVRPSNITVGDFPELGLEELDEI